MHFADRVIVLHHGAVAIDGNPRKMMTAEIMRRVFEVDATIQHIDAGIPFVLPQRMRPPAKSKRFPDEH
jgi:iron complex transport system ATP-binding protein